MIGEQALDFELTTHFGEKWQLSDHLGSVVALLFYPGNETFVCTKQLCSVRDYWEEYLTTNAKVVAISRGPQEDNRTFAERLRLPMPLLEDVDGEITQKFISHPIWPLIFMRGIVVIDSKGIIRTQTAMLRAFRPRDKEVLRAIYSAKSDEYDETFKKIIKKDKEKRR